MLKNVNPITETDPKYLWRYINLYKLIDLIKTSSFYFSRFDQFEDLYEGISLTQALKKSSDFQVKLLGYFSQIISDRHESSLEFRQKKYFGLSWYLSNPPYPRSYKLRAAFVFCKLYLLKSPVK